ncbi:unnamed protein product [Malus baccata var. baccata]
MNPSSMNLNTVKPFTGINYKKWKQDLEIVLGVMDWDLTLRTEEPPMSTDGSTSSQRSKYEKWQKSNRISLMIIKRSMTNVVRGGFPDATNAKDFLASIKEKYKESPKTEIGNLMNSLTTMRYDGIESVREYILKMMDVAGKLRALEVPISKTFLVHVIMNSLPDSYTQLKVSYNALREKWDVNELIAICYEKEKDESFNLVHGAYKAHKPSAVDVTKKETLNLTNHRFSNAIFARKQVI